MIAKGKLPGLPAWRLPSQAFYSLPSSMLVVAKPG